MLTCSLMLLAVVAGGLVGLFWDDPLAGVVLAIFATWAVNSALTRVAYWRHLALVHRWAVGHRLSAVKLRPDYRRRSPLVWPPWWRDVQHYEMNAETRQGQRWHSEVFITGVLWGLCSLTLEVGGPHTPGPEGDPTWGH